MKVSSFNHSTAPVTRRAPTIRPQSQQNLYLYKTTSQIIKTIKKQRSFRVQAAKPPPSGVVVPKVEPKFQAPFLGFTTTAEIWNSRACMIGLIGTFIVEFILNQGILQVIGVDVGKGLNLPL